MQYTKCIVTSGLVGWAQAGAGLWARGALGTRGAGPRRRACAHLGVLARPTGCALGDKYELIYWINGLALLMNAGT